MNFRKTILSIINEDIGYINTSKTKPIVDAIKNKTKISFMYSGPLKPNKIAVKPGKRINAEPVAIGLSKKGNLILRAWVGPPSVSKKGFSKTNWRTFIVGRMRNIEIHDDTFVLKPGFKTGNDNSMSVTYVSADKTQQPKVKVTPKVPPVKPIQPKKPEPPKPVQPKKPEPPKPTEPKKPETKKQELPQPKPQPKPSKTPETKTSKPQPQPQSKPQPKPQPKPSKTPDEDDKEPLIGLSEVIKRIKTLILY